MWKSAVVAVLAVLAFQKCCDKPALPVTVDGTVEKKFKAVQELFRQNFENGQESEGAAVAVYHNGKLVVDLWGGYAESDAVRPWEKDTMTTIFSSSKAVTSLALAHLVDSGLVSYDDLVIKHWPEFGKKGKENVTIAMLISHQAGLALYNKEITLDLLVSPEKMAKVIENQKPNWPPGTATGYHAFTHGFPIDQIIQRVDPRKRTLGKYIQDELITTTGAETCYIGMPSWEEYRVAHMTWSEPCGLKSKITKAVFDVIGGVFGLIYGKSPIEKSFDNPSWFMGGTWLKRNGLNNPAVHRVEIGAANGICTARGLGQPFNAFVMGKLVSKKTIDRLITPPIKVGTVDKVIGFDMPRVMGLGFWTHNKTEHGATNLINHMGLGGQDVHIDVKNKLVFVYITNGLKALSEANQVSDALLDEVYKAIKN